MRPQPLTVTVVPGPSARTWCAACKAWTRLAGSLLLLAENGVSTVGAWSWCEICDDPADQPGGAR